MHGRAGCIDSSGIGLSCVVLRTAAFLSTSSYNQVSHKTHFGRLSWKAQFTPFRNLKKKKKKKTKERKEEGKGEKERGRERGRKKGGRKRRGILDRVWCYFTLCFKCPKLARVPFVSPLKSRMREGLEKLFFWRNEIAELLSVQKAQDKVAIDWG